MYNELMIKVTLAYVMLDNEISGTELAERIGIDKVNLSRIKTGNIRAIRFSTLDALCRELECQPGDILTYIDDETARKKKRKR